MSGFEGEIPEHSKEIRDYLENEDLYPAPTTNEFDGNKEIKNPEKSE